MGEIMNQLDKKDSKNEYTILIRVFKKINKESKKANIKKIKLESSIELIRSYLKSENINYYNKLARNIIFNK